MCLHQEPSTRSKLWGQPTDSSQNSTLSFLRDDNPGISRNEIDSRPLWPGKIEPMDLRSSRNDMSDFKIARFFWNIVGDRFPSFGTQFQIGCSMSHSIRRSAIQPDWLGKSRVNVQTPSSVTPRQFSGPVRRVNYTPYLQHFFPVKHSALMPIFTDWVEEMTIEARLCETLRSLAFFCGERSQTTQITCHGLSGKHQITCHGFGIKVRSHVMVLVLSIRSHVMVLDLRSYHMSCFWS
jgi:hypothetical protein